ncbi:MAG: DUF4864 domain-containing protein [Pseudomonadota bacterium]
MRFVRVFLAILSSILWLGAASAEDALPRDAGIEATIDAQIDAFLKDDFATAFTYASPNIQGFFGTSERFGQMVRNGYPMVWRPGDVQYLDLRDVAGNLWQKVLITDQSGGVHVLDYQMIQTSEGWRINGVQILQAPDVSA